MSLSSITPGSLLDSPLASTLTPSTYQAVSTGTHLDTASALNGGTSYAPVDPITQDLITLLKSLAYGDIAGAKTDLSKYKADLKAQTTAAASKNIAKERAALSKEQTSGGTSATQAASQSDSLAASLSASLRSGSVQDALKDLTGYLVQNGQVSGGLINTSG